MGVILKKMNEQLLKDLAEGSAIRPVRQVTHRSPQRTVGILACSWIQDRGIEYESQLERRFLLQTLVLPMVKRVVHQPFRIEYIEDGAPRTYVPDFLVLLKDGTKVVIEIKPRKFLKKHRAKLIEAQRLLANNDIPFLVITDWEIDDGIKVENASFLLRFARGSASLEAKQQCLDTIMSAPSGLSIDALSQISGLPQKDILHFIGRTVLSIDLSEPITGTTIVHIQKDFQNDYLQFINWFNTAPGHAIAGISEND
ncbi:hypothetical protein FEE59_19350 [Herbaspirillum sp. RU 5E]|nr:hypothetical protein [Herbaspirillum sp. RU 5E]